MKIPKKLRIAGIDYTIEVISDLESYKRGILGQYKSDEAKIEVYRNLQADVLSGVLIHEVLHAIYKHWGIKEGDDEERCVDAISNGLNQVFKDNPDFVNFIKECSK